MSKESVTLSLRDMYAIKHALQERYDRKNKRLENMVDNIYECFGPEEDQEMKRLFKDTKHEKALIKKFEDEIRGFKVRHKI